MVANEIWRIDPDGGEPQRVAGDLGVPDAVKFDSEGFIVSTQVASGQVLRIDPRNGEQTLLAQLNPGLDNLTFVGDRLFVSNFTGEITEILGGGETRTVLPGGLNWPLDLAVGDDGSLYVADGTYFYVVGRRRVAADGRDAVHPRLSRLPSRLGSRGTRRVRGHDVGRPDRPLPARRRRNRLPGRRIRPALRRRDRTRRHHRLRRTRHRAGARAAIGQRRGAGLRTCAIRSASRSTPTAAPWWPNPARVGWCGSPGRPRPWSTDCSGRRASSSRDGQLYIVDAGAKEVIAVDLDTRRSRTPSPPGLPVGPPPGVEPKPLKGMPPFSGPQGPFAGIAVGPDGTLYVSADGDGSVLALRRVGHVTVTPADHRYLQVARTLRKEIVDGVYPVGSQLPTEHELCERFAVSRYTVREALRRLRDDNLVASRPAPAPWSSRVRRRIPMRRT